MAEISQNINFYKDFLEERIKRNLYRQLPQNNRKNLIEFSSNDYLGLSREKEILEAAYSCGLKSGIGATGSRILSGNNSISEELEQQIAQDKHTEAALIINSGFQTNMTSLSALLDRSVLRERAIVFFDRLNHASLYHAVLFANAELVRYRHCDIEHLSQLMEKYTHDRRPKFIVTETLFGMDGDIPNMEHVISLAHRHNALLYLDEAHAVGVFGEKGYGISTNFDLSGITHVIMGTFSKAIGGFGGYIASSKLIREFLINKCTGFIYSTALPAMLLGGVAKAWETIALLGKKRETLLDNANKFRKSLEEDGCNLGNSSSHIIPIILGKEEEALKMQGKLLENGIGVSAIRPPTVPVNTARIRIALRTSHTRQDIDQLLTAIRNIRNQKNGE